MTRLADLAAHHDAQVAQLEQRVQHLADQLLTAGVHKRRRAVLRQRVLTELRHGHTAAAIALLDDVAWDA